MKSEEHMYEVDLKWERDSIGTLSSERLSKTIEVATPPEFTGGVDGIWSPEHLFIASVSSCFMTTFTAIAEFSKLDYESLEVKAEGTMAKQDGKYIMSQIILKPTLIIADEKYTDKALRILQKAESACLITRSIKAEVKLEPKVVAGALA